MRMPSSSLQHTYRLVLADDDRGTARTIEFDANCADSALYLAQRQCGGRQAELFEDERSLGKLQCAQNGGFWLLSASGAAADHG